jgi:hypothetical protein
MYSVDKFWMHIFLTDMLGTVPRYGRMQPRANLKRDGFMIISFGGTQESTMVSAAAQITRMIPLLWALRWTRSPAHSWTPGFGLTWRRGRLLQRKIRASFTFSPFFCASRAEHSYVIRAQRPSVRTLCINEQQL